MPLRPDLRNLRDANGELVYRGPAWKAQRQRLLGRAGNKCERCRKPNHEIVHTVTAYHFVDAPARPHMVWRIPLPGTQWRDERGRRVTRAQVALCLGRKQRLIRVVLTMAHLTHDPLRNRDDEKAMLCQWCHLNYDKLHHKDTRAARKDAARPLLAGVA